MPSEHLMEALVARIQHLPLRNGRRLVAVAGPPASGKSTLAARLARTLGAVALPMDGFHLDNAVLQARGLLDRKGAPNTFDTAGFLTLLSALQQGGDVTFPLFDRAQDCTLPDAGMVSTSITTVIVEGNYLLHDAPGWDALHPLWDFSIFLEVPEATLHARLVQRWLDHGLSPSLARARTEHNDLPNARVISGSAALANVIL